MSFDPITGIWAAGKSAPKVIRLEDYGFHPYMVFMVALNSGTGMNSERIKETESFWNEIPDTGLIDIVYESQGPDNVLFDIHNIGCTIVRNGRIPMEVSFSGSLIIQNVVLSGEFLLIRHPDSAETSLYVFASQKILSS